MNPLQMSELATIVLNSSSCSEENKKIANDILFKCLTIMNDIASAQSLGAKGIITN